jgi:hypothetical protein
MKYQCGLTALALAWLVSHGPADEAQPKGKEKADPTKVLVEARLIVKKDTYALDLGGKTAEQYRKQIEQANNAQAPPVPPPLVDLVLEFHNVSDKEIKLWDAGFRGGSTRLELDLQGPGARKIIVTGPPVGANIPPPTPKEVVLAPGKSFSMPIKSLAVLDQYRAGPVLYWTEAGAHTLKASFHTAISPAPPGTKEPVWIGRPMIGVDPKARTKGFGQITLTSAAVKFKVEEKK